MNSNKELISIIVAVYNAEQYLEVCVKSILAQTYQNIEILLVNDGSKDNSLQICQRFADSDSRIVVIDKENGGCYSAWNKGIEVATGSYIGFVDNDDYIAPEMYELLYNMMHTYNADIAACNRFRNINNMNSFTKMNKVTDVTHEYTGHEAVKHLLCDTSYLKPAVWDKLYNCQIFNTLRFPNTFFEDAAISYQLLYNANKVIYSEKQLYAYSVRNGSMITSSWNAVKTKSYLDVTNSAIEFFATQNEIELFHSAIYWQLQFGIEALERLQISNESTESEYDDIMQTLRIHYQKLNLRILRLSTIKYIKKTIEFLMLTKCPQLLLLIKKGKKG